MTSKIFKMWTMLLLLAVGAGLANAQSVNFTHSLAKGYQQSENHYWTNFSNMTYNYSSNADWGPNCSGSDHYIYSGSLPTNSWQQVLRRYNDGWWSGELFDWFYLTYTAPSYERVVYTLYYYMSVYTATGGTSCRTAYFDYGTDPSGYWSSRSYGPSGNYDIRTAYGALDSNSQDETTHLTQGDGESGTKSSSTFSLSVTVNNYTGSSTRTEYRYGGFSSSKSVNGDKKNHGHRTRLLMQYSYTRHYWKHITYYPNGATSSTSTQVQRIEDSGTLKASSTFSRKNHIFNGWYTAASAGTKYTAGSTLTVNASTKGTMNLYAQWTPVQFTFMNGDTNLGSANAQSDNSLPALADSYKPAAGAKQFFCGYYTQAGGKGIQVYDSNLNPTTAGQNQNFTANTTLYAHFITTQHTATWDYTYRTDHDTYDNLNDHNRYCRLQFKDGSGAVIKNVYLTAPEVQNVTNPNSSNHTTAQVVVDLAVGTATDITDAANAKIYFTQAQLESMRGYQFDVWTTADAQGQKASLWVTTTNASAHTTTFNYGQLSDNMFMLKWNVTLHDLNRYPDKIYAKPMILVDGKYQEIDQMTAVIGEDCYVTSEVTNSKGTLGAGSYATYYGEYPVLKNETGGSLATYKVGMSGFYLAGSNYFLNQNEGHVSADFVSGDNVIFSTSSENTITYHIYDYQIPVVQVLPANPALNAANATVNYLPMALYVDEARAGTVNLSHFVARRPHFNFLGWYDAEWTEATKTQKIWAADANYEFHTGTQPHGGTRTIVALWKRDSDPEASIEMTEGNGGFTYTITATDAVEVKAVKYLIQDSTVAAPTAQSADWELLEGENDVYTIRIDSLNDQYGKILYVLVQNETESVVLKANEPIRSYWNIPANADPDSRVANMRWEGDEETGSLQPDGTYSYTYYSTFYDSQQSYKLNGGVQASVVASAEGGNLVINPLGSNAHGEVIIRKGTAVILSGMTNMLPLELVTEGYVAEGDLPVENNHQPEGEDPENQESNAPARVASSIWEIDNILEGVDEDTYQDSRYTYYVLSYAQYGLGFYQNLPERQLAAHKAFFTVPARPSVAPRGFVLDIKGGNQPIATAIENTEVQEVISGPVYDIYGHVVAPSLDQAGHLANGLYIVGGKKVVINK